MRRWNDDGQRRWPVVVASSLVVAGSVMALTAFSIEPAASPPFGVSIPDGQVRLAAVMPEAAFGHFRPLGARPRKSAFDDVDGSPPLPQHGCG
jgi:hypothetical protein